MAKLLSSSDFAIASAIKDGSIRVEERQSRFGDAFFAILDGLGTIEVCDTLLEAESRVERVRGLIK